MIDVHFTVSSYCACCGEWEKQVVFVGPGDGSGTLYCLGCAKELRSALSPAWKRYHKQAFREDPALRDLWREILQSHSAAERMRDMSNDEFLKVLEAFMNEQPLLSVQGRIVTEAIRRLGGEDEWTEDGATERQ